jgi:hypothetical protein
MDVDPEENAPAPAQGQGKDSDLVTNVLSYGEDEQDRVGVGESEQRVLSVGE